MNNKELLDLEIEIDAALFDLTDFSIYRFETQEASDEAYEAVDEYKEDAIVAIRELINEQVAKALEEVKSKQVEIFPCDCQFNKGFAYKKGDPCDGSCVLAPYRERVVSAIDEVERKYRNE